MRRMGAFFAEIEKRYTGAREDILRRRQEAGKQKVTGIGGVFFRAHNPETLSRWSGLIRRSFDQSVRRRPNGV
jgi:hypothetical protein